MSFLFISQLLSRHFESRDSSFAKSLFSHRRTRKRLPGAEALPYIGLASACLVLTAACNMSAGSKTLCWHGFSLSVPTRCILPSSLRASAVGIRFCVPGHSPFVLAAVAVPTMPYPPRLGTRTGPFQPPSAGALWSATVRSLSCLPQFCVGCQYSIPPRG